MVGTDLVQGFPRSRWVVKNGGANVCDDQGPLRRLFDGIGNASCARLRTELHPREVPMLGWTGLLWVSLTEGAASSEEDN
jgi:hypothetical protein